MDDRDRDDAATDGLRKAWRDLTPPAPADGGEPADVVTRAAVAWMATAWKNLPAPVAGMRRSAAPVRLRFRFRRAAAAALLVAAAGAGSWWLFTNPGAGPGPSVPPGTGAPDPGTSVAGGGPPAVAVLTASADRIEMQSGPVRLVLLTSANPDDPTPNGDLQ